MILCALKTSRSGMCIPFDFVVDVHVPHSADVYSWIVH